MARAKKNESMKISPLAGKPAPRAILVDVPRLISSYYTGRPDPGVTGQRVAFGTSGHRGSSLELTFNEAHVLAISQAVCDYRKKQGVDGPLFIGADTHALSVPASRSALEVFAANGVHAMISTNDETTPTPAVSLAILAHNKGRRQHLADGIVITPSHNPPDNGGYKYNPSNGGPADVKVTGWIQNRANKLLEAGLKGVKRSPYDKALTASTTRRYDFLGAYVTALRSVVDMDVLKSATLHMGVDPLGGAGVHYWAHIADRYKLNLDIVSEQVEPDFRFMTVDWDGKIRMDPSSPYAMKRLIRLKSQFDIAFCCDTDYDRHGVVTRSVGLLPPNHYLAVLVDYLFSHRSRWGKRAAVGKTLVSSQIIDRVAARLGRGLVEVPVGFKWFVDGLFDGSLGFGGEESAGTSFLRRDGTTWTTDKDGMIAALLSAEMTARTGIDPGEHYKRLAHDLGEPVDTRFEAPATPEQKQRLAAISARDVHITDLAGEKVDAILTRAPGNNAPIGGVKVVSRNGWFAARPSGTENIYKIYAESFLGENHVQRLVAQAHDVVDKALGAGARSQTASRQGGRRAGKDKA
ncbi:MAG TPA: phosphoglucomutase (alpha-D-glucose-1,6-bisphosphate-dependent) [Burkholderiaceae bacterium]|nr:phosphoglucomutase (alpha-D-glucose-1,6-bisphosphate-dependent) [Burkholderiaceae bacterium]